MRRPVDILTVAAAIVVCWLSAVVCGVSNTSSGYREEMYDLLRSEALLSALKWDPETMTTTSSSSGGQGVAPLMVNLTLIHGADSKGAVCLDGSLPGYHLDRGFGSGQNSWLVDLEGGGWCNTVRSCVFRKTTRRGSSKFMEKKLEFTGILSNNAEENPDFYNWNRVRVRYCDGASFAGEGFDEAAQLYFRGQRIWSVAMEALMAEGMKSATRALLSGCSAGGLASIIHCDEFRDLFPRPTKVKCLADAGMFMDALDVSGGHALRDIYTGVVRLQNVHKNLPNTCDGRIDQTLCFFPQHLVNGIRTPMFLLNSAYDIWQLQESLTPPSADPHGDWSKCRKNHAQCNSSQIAFLQDFRKQMLGSLKVFGASDQNGLFINSCFSHCQSERQDMWFAADSPLIGKKRIAESVGDWYFDQSEVKAIDCPYPCDNSCHNLIFKWLFQKLYASCITESGIHCPCSSGFVPLTRRQATCKSCI